MIYAKEKMKQPGLKGLVGGKAGFNGLKEELHEEGFRVETCCGTSTTGNVDETLNKEEEVIVPAVVNSMNSEQAIDYLADIHKQIDNNDFQSDNIKSSYQSFTKQLHKQIFEKIKKLDGQQEKGVYDKETRNLLRLAKIITGREGNIDNELKTPQFSSEIILHLMYKKDGIMRKISENIKIEDKKIGNRAPGEIVREFKSKYKPGKGIKILKLLGFKDISTEKFESRKQYEKLSLQQKVEISTLVRLMEAQKENPKKDLGELLQTVAKTGYETVVGALNENFEASLFDWNGKNSKDYGLKGTEAEIFDLFNDIQGNGLFDFSDSTLSTLKEAGKIGGMLGVGIVSGVIAGPIVLATGLSGIGAAVATGMAIGITCTTAGALLNMQGYDTKRDATKDIGSDLVVNSMLGGLGAGATAKFGKDLSKGLSVGAVAQNTGIEGTDFLAGTLAEKYRQELVLGNQANLGEMIQNGLVVLLAGKAGGKMIEKNAKGSAKDSEYYKSDFDTGDKLVGNLAKINKEGKITFNAKSIIEFGKTYGVEIKITKVDGKVLFNSKSFKQFLSDLRKDPNQRQCAINLIKEMKRIKGHEVIHRLLKNMKSVEIDGQVFSQEKIAKIVSGNENLPQKQLKKLEIELKKQIGDDFKLLGEDGNINSQLVRQYDTVNLTERSHSRLAESYMPEERLVKRYDLEGKKAIDIEREIDKVYLSDKEVKGYLDSMRVIEEGMEKMKITSIQLADNFDLPKSQLKFRNDFKESVTKLIDNNDTSKLIEVCGKIDNLLRVGKQIDLGVLNVLESYDYLKRLEITVNKSIDDIDYITRNLEEYLKLKVLDKAIEENKINKLYNDYSNEIRILHAGIDSKTGKGITEAIIDINIVKNNGIRELEDFERFIRAVERRKFNEEKVIGYKKKYICDYGERDICVV